MDKLRSAKDFLKEYVQRKGMSRLKFANSLGLSRNFLAGRGTITVANLQKIIQHPDYQDFNYEALLKGQGAVIKEPVELVEGNPLQGLVRDASQQLQRIGSGHRAADPEVSRKLIALLEQTLEKVDDFSSKYQELDRRFIKIRSWLEREFWPVK